MGIGEPPLRDARFLHFPQKENIVGLGLTVARMMQCTPSFWHAKNNLVSRHQEVGLGQIPPPQFGNFSHIIPFFSDNVP